MGNKLLLLLYLLIPCSCVSVSTLDIQVLEPAAEPLTPYVDRPALVSRINSDLKGDSGKNLPDVAGLHRDAALEALYSLAHILNESPGMDYIDSSLVMIELQDAGPYSMKTPIDPAKIIELCRRLDTDAVMALEVFYIRYDSTLVLKSGGQSGWLSAYYHGNLNVAINALWRVYEGESGYQADEFSLTDTIVWEYSSFRKWQVEKYLPTFEKASLEAAYFTALVYSRRIAPHWMEEERSYFFRGNLRIRRAADHIRNNRLDQAEMILLELLNRRNTYTVAAACYNLALINELRGEYREALKLARLSYHYRMHPLTAGYIETLEERLGKSYELDRQLGRED